MTPERIAEIRELAKVYTETGHHALEELLTEVESLTRALEQAEEALERRPDNQIERNKTT